MFNKLRCATDGSKASEKAADFAVEFANRLDDELARRPMTVIR